MTGKRFTLAYADYDWWAICDKENPTELGISGEDVVELLNEQHEQIQELQMRYDAQRELYCELDCVKNNLYQENKQLKQELFETSKELLWATSDEVDRVLYYEDEVEELRKEIFE